MRKLAYTALTFTWVMSASAFAQTEVVSTATAGSTNSLPSALSASPVSVSEGMAPAAAPAAPVAAAPTTVAATSPSTVGGNSTTVNVNAAANATADAQNESFVDGRMDNLKRERMRREANNEGRLIEKLEQGRLEDESRRAEEIEKFRGRGEEPQAMAPVAPAPAPTPAPVETTVIAPVIVNTIETEAQESESSEATPTRLRVSPYIGYRWTSGSYALKVQNRFATGILLEGAITNWLSLEGSFNFAQDEFRNKGGVYATSAYNNSTYASNYSSFIRTRNTFGVMGGAKIGLTWRSFRPFASAGFGGRFSKYDIDSYYVKQMAAAAGWQRSTNGLIASAGAGLDYSIARNFGVGVRYDFEASLNKKKNAMNAIYGDSANGSRISANVQVMF